VVNALLTQIDQLKRHDNVVILATSNITGAIGNIHRNFTLINSSCRFSICRQSRYQAVHWIAFFGSSISHPFIVSLWTNESGHHITSGTVSCAVVILDTSMQQNLLDFKAVQLMKEVQSDSTRLSNMLYDTCAYCDGLSGRALRKLPFLAHSFFFRVSDNNVIVLNWWFSI
jgi:hypothetical protein